jgi:DNA polymerase-3 subunit epsilon
MTDALSLFGGPPETPGHGPSAFEHQQMSDSQRTRIRELFRQLGLVEARDQFAVVKELTGREITSVAQVDAADARRLILLLPAKIESARSDRTGNSWTDRTEETWIDRL